MRKSLLLSFLVIFVLPGIIHSQNLADIARKEKENRERLKTPVKVYTNDDLEKYGHFSTPEATPVAPAGGSVEASPAATAKVDKPDTKGEPEDPSSEKYWSKRFIEAKAKLQTAKNRQQALQAKLNDYNLKLMNQSDVYDREHLYMPLIAQTQDDIAKNNSEIVGVESELDGLRDELRKSGNPASWENSQLALQPAAETGRPQQAKVKDQKYWQEQLTQIDKRYDELISPLNEERFQLLNRRSPREGEANPSVNSTAIGLPPRVVDIDIQIKELNQRRQQEKNNLIDDAIRQGALPGWFR
ncbi:MAG TPA: hypothetical protein VMW38_10970 [Terriglobia bacterium]|nr:hypothetical protein [Terriglobia bacterium]